MKKLLFITCLLLISVCTISAQNTWVGWAPQELPEQDCVGALPVFSPIIHFNKQLGDDDDDIVFPQLPEINSDAICMYNYQNRAIWLKIKTTTDGLLGFKIRNNKRDYIAGIRNPTWAVFNLQGQPCSVLKTAGSNFTSQYVIACNYNGLMTEYTGAFEPVTDTIPNFGVEPRIPVAADQTYYLFINYWEQDSTQYHDYTVDFTPSTTTFAGWASVSGNVYFDENNNCIEENVENKLSGIIVTATNTLDTTNKFYTCTNLDGSYVIPLPSDSINYSLTVQALSPILSQGCVPNVIITPLDTIHQNVDIGLTALNNAACPYITISSVAGLYRPPVNTTRQVKLQNSGSAIAVNKKLKIVYDSNNYILPVFPLNIPYAHTFDNNTLEIELPTLQIGETVIFSYQEDVWNDVILPVDTQTIILKVEDICTQNNTVYQQQFIDSRAILAAYDPNDKSANPAGAGPYNTINRDAFIDYTIRFQNEGTDTAFTVKVVDTLSAYLDVSTLQLGASSHNYSAELCGQGVLTYTFNNILLPQKAVDEEGSMGYFTYRIKQKSSNPENYQIKNRAHIYFDFNDAIITNTYAHSIGVFTDLPILNPANKIGVQLYPNPAKENIQFSVLDLKPNENCKLIIYNSMGVKIQEYDYLTGNIAINLQNVNSGNYFYRLYTTLGRSAIGSFIKQ